MTCDQASTWLSAHLDDELDVTGAVGMERHLAECPACRAKYDEGLAMRAAIRGGELYYDPPAALARRVRTAVRKESPAPWWRWPAIAALAAAAIFAVFVLRTERPVAAEIVASHVRSLQADHLVDVASSDRHTVKPWFQGKLDFAPPVPDLAELIGGRLDYIEGRPVAALVYQRRRHRINVFVWPDTASGPSRHESSQGYQLVHWNAAGMTWWAISDLNAAELAQFAGEMSNRQ